MSFKTVISCATNSSNSNSDILKLIKAKSQRSPVALTSTGQICINTERRLPPIVGVVFWLISSSSLQRTGAVEYVGGFQVVGIEEGSHLIGQLGQDTLSQGHAASLQQGEAMKAGKYSHIHCRNKIKQACVAAASEKYSM